MDQRDKRQDGSIDGRIERAKDSALGAHSGTPSTADEVGEAAGGISGVLVGAGIGAAAGPVGALIGGIAGALGGWWTGRAVSEAAERLTESDDAYFRQHFEALPNRPADVGFDSVREAYYLGQIASHNPNFVDREFAEIEPELERGWNASGSQRGPWSTYQPFASTGYAHGVERRARERRLPEVQPPGERRV